MVKKKGFLASLFGGGGCDCGMAIEEETPKKSACCDMQIVEEEKKKKDSCCGMQIIENDDYESVDDHEITK